MKEKLPKEYFWRIGDYHPLVYLCMAFSQKFRWQMRNYEEAYKKNAQLESDLRTLARNKDNEEADKILHKYRSHLLDALRAGL